MMENKKTIISLVLACSLILCSCSKETDENTDDTSSVTEIQMDENEPEQTGNPDEISETASSESSSELIIGELPVISIKTQIINETDNFTLPEFSLSEESIAIEKINTSIENFEKAYKILDKNQSGDEGIECLTYSFVNKRYATAVIKWKQTPDNKSDGDIYSFVYDGATRKYYTLDRMLYEKGMSKEDISAKFTEYYKTKNQDITVVSADTEAFRITSSDTLELYINVIFSDGISRIYIYTPESETFVQYSNEYMESAVKFESITSLADVSESEEKYTLDGIEYTEKELIAAANKKYIEAYNAVSYLFYGKGTYGSEYTEHKGKKFYKSTEPGYETYESAINNLKSIFLMPEEYFSNEIETKLYEDENGDLWISTDFKDIECKKTGVTEVDSVMESLAVFRTNSEMEGDTAVSDYFTLIASGDSFKCTYFVYPASEATAETTTEKITETTGVTE